MLSLNFWGPSCISLLTIPVILSVNVPAEGNELSKVHAHSSLLKFFFCVQYRKVSLGHFCCCCSQKFWNTVSRRLYHLSIDQYRHNTLSIYKVIVLYTWRHCVRLLSFQWRILCCNSSFVHIKVSYKTRIQSGVHQRMLLHSWPKDFYVTSEKQTLTPRIIISLQAFTNSQGKDLRLMLL